MCKEKNKNEVRNTDSLAKKEHVFMYETDAEIIALPGGVL